MKNYELLIEFIKKKRLARAAINPLLIVDKQEHLIGVEKNWENRSLKDTKVVLYRPLTEEE